MSGTMGISGRAWSSSWGRPRHVGDPEKGEHRCSRGYRQSREGCVLLPPRDTYSATVKVVVKFLDFVQCDGLKCTVLSLSQKSELAMEMSLGVTSRRHQLGRY